MRKGAKELLKEGGEEKRMSMRNIAEIGHVL